jgi:hypothetical protein
MPPRAALPKIKFKWPINIEIFLDFVKGINEKNKRPFGGGQTHLNLSQKINEIGKKCRFFALMNHFP